jgi:hypothetical protein
LIKKLQKLLLLVAIITLGPIHSADEPKSSSSTATTTATSTEPFIATTTTEVKKPTVKKVVEEDVSEWRYPELKRICSCESTGSPNNEPRQFNKDGSLLKGVVNPNDWGMCQINIKYHKADAEKMGLNLATAKGNKKYAEHLYKTQGAQPWSWSNSCHHTLDN